jgi:hypothetical protein
MQPKTLLICVLKEYMDMPHKYASPICFQQNELCVTLKLSLELFMLPCFRYIELHDIRSDAFVFT